MSWVATILNSTDYCTFPSPQKFLLGSTVLEIKIIITEIKKSINGLNIRLNKAKQKISKLEK